MVPPRILRHKVLELVVRLHVGPGPCLGDRVAIHAGLGRPQRTRLLDGVDGDLQVVEVFLRLELVFVDVEEVLRVGAGEADPA